MMTTAGDQPPAVEAAMAAGTGSSYLETANDKEARGHALPSRGPGGRVEASSVLEKSESMPSAESLDASPLPVFRQSVSSALTGAGSGSLLMNGRSSSYKNSSLEREAGGTSTRDTGRASRGAVLGGAGEGLAAAARKGEKGKAAREGQGGRGEAAHAAERGRAPRSLGSSTRTRCAEAAAVPVGITPDKGAGQAAAATAAGGGGSCGDIVGDGASAAAAAEKTGGTRAGTAGRGGWTALFQGASREGRTGHTPERCLLINNGGDRGRPAGAPPDEGMATAAAETASPGGGTGVGRPAAGGAEQQGLLQQRAGKEQKARQWMLAGLVAYFILGLLVLYCVSYTNVEWCCIFIIFGVTVGGVGLAGLRHSSRLLLLIHVGAAGVLLFTLFVAWCYNMHVLLRAIEILLASSWPPLHHQQFKYYYSIPTAYEAAPAPWLEEVLLMRFRYPSEDDPGIRKLIGAQQQQQGKANTSNRRRGKKTVSTTDTSNRDGHITGEKAPTPAEKGGPREVTAADAGGPDAAEGPEAGRQPGKAAGAEAAELQGRKDLTAGTPTAEQGSRTAPGRRLGSVGSAEQRSQAAVVSASDWRRGLTNRRSAGAETSALGWGGRRLAETRQTEQWRNMWPQFGKERELRSRGGRSSTGASQQEGGMQGRPALGDAAVGGEKRRGSLSSGFPLEKVAAAAPPAGGKEVGSTVLSEAAGTGEGGPGREKETGAVSAALGEKMRQHARSRGGNRRLQGRPAPADAAARGPGVTRLPSELPGGREPGRGNPSPPRAIPEKEGGAEDLGDTEEDEKRRTPEEAEGESSAPVGERAPADAPPGEEVAGPYAAAGPPAASLEAPSPAAAAAGAPVTAEAGAAATGPVSAAENASWAGQQLRGSGAVQQQEEKEEAQEGRGTEEKGGRQAGEEETGPSRGAESPAASKSLSSVLWLAAEQTGAPTAQQQMQQRIFMERDAAARGLIKGCVEGAERNTNFLNEAAHAMSSLATRGWLCAFARAEILPFHRWPVDCSSECGYGFLDTGHDLQPGDYYDMTRVAEYLIQISSLPPKSMQQCVDYAASTVCSIKNRNFFAVWVALLLLWLLLACAACCSILPLSLYKTVQVIKAMQQS